MRTNSVTNGICQWIVVSCFLAGPTFGENHDQSKGQQSAPQNQDPHFGAASTAIAALQDAQRKSEDALVDQHELDELIHSGGGGGCPSAAAIDALQTLRIMAGLKRLPNPHKAVLAAFTDDKELLNGRLTNEQFVKLLHFYEQNYLDGKSIKVHVELPPMSPFSPTAQTWSAADGPDLSVAPGRLKIVTFNVTQPTGELIGRHFVLLKDKSEHEIAVLDPSAPTKDLSYVVSQKQDDKPKPGHWFLLQPADKPSRDRVFEVNAVFTLELLHDVDGHAAKRAPGEVKKLNSLIDIAAEKLRDAGDLRSPRKWRETTASFGLPGLDLPIKYGGSAWPAAKVLEVFMHLGRHDLNCRDVVGGAHARPLLKSKNEPVLDIVRQVAAGNAYMAIAMTEPDAGSNIYGITSTAKKVDGGYKLTGEKRYIARLEQATHVIIFTQPANGSRRGLSAFVLPINTPGLERNSFEAHGLKGNSFGGLKFNDLFVDDGRLLGADGEGDNIFFSHFRYWRLMQVGAALGTAERALEMMADRLSSRKAFGGPIGRFTHLQEALGQHTTELKMAKSLAREAARMLDRKDFDNADPIINGLKAEGVEIALRAVDSATRAFGAEGYSNRVDLGDRLQDLNGLRIADGTTDVMRMNVVRRSYKNGNELWDMAVKGSH